MSQQPHGFRPRRLSTYLRFGITFESYVHLQKPNSKAWPRRLKPSSNAKNGLKMKMLGCGRSWRLKTKVCAYCDHLLRTFLINHLESSIASARNQPDCGKHQCEVPRNCFHIRGESGRFCGGL